MKIVKQYKLEELNDGKFKLKFRLGKKFLILCKWYDWYYYQEIVNGASQVKIYNNLYEVANDIKYEFIGKIVTFE